MDQTRRALWEGRSSPGGGAQGTHYTPPPCVERTTPRYEKGTLTQFLRGATVDAVAKVEKITEAYAKRGVKLTGRRRTSLSFATHPSVIALSF